MDVDLSTDLRALLPLVAPLVSGHSDLAIGSRLGPGARVVLDCELMPWSVKAQELLRRQYAAVGRAGRSGMGAAIDALRQASGGGVAVGDLLERCQGQLADLERFVEAYRRYCWPVAGVTDLKLAPFHVMATEGAVHTDKDHQWHMETLSALAAADDGLLLATANKVVDVMDPASEAEAIGWWEGLTGAGGPQEAAAPGP